MPIYEYQCEQCEHKMEALQKISDEPLQECPQCGKSSLRKLVSAAAFRLKGSGWYETDFKDKKEQKNLSKSDDNSSAKSSSSGSDSAKTSEAKGKADTTKSGTSGSATTTD